jgi:hypothetical protein
MTRLGRSRVISPFTRACVPGIQTVEHGHSNSSSSECSVHARHAVIVRGADTARLDLALQCAGPYAISLGLSANFPDDHVRHGLVICDALYACCARLQDETHTWPPASYHPACLSMSAQYLGELQDESNRDVDDEPRCSRSGGFG